MGKNANLNIGIEAKLFDRVSATIEWYQRKTTDMLMSFPMASSLGFDGYNKTSVVCVTQVLTLH